MPDDVLRVPQGRKQSKSSHADPEVFPGKARSVCKDTEADRYARQDTRSVTDPGGAGIITDTVFKEEEAETKGSLKQTLFINWKDNRRRDQFTCLDNATFRMDVKEHWQDGQIVHVRGASFYRGVCRTCPNNHKVEHRHDVSPHLPQPAYNYCHFIMPS